MEVHSRRHRTAQLQDQENVQAIKGKLNSVPVKKQGLAVRGALGDLNTNAQVQRDINVGKVAVATAEFEKKSSLCRPPSSKTYSHVQSKVDTGRAGKTIQPSSRPPLRREESTAGLAVKASARNWVTSKDTLKLADKENLNVNISAKNSKKTTKMPAIKENIPSTTSAVTLKPILKVKPMLKESTESLGKLKIDEKTQIKLKKHPSLQNQSVKEFNLDLDNTPELPEDIEDIDAEDYNKLTLMTVYIKDIYRYLRELEDKFPIRRDYLKDHDEILPKMRATLIDWLVEVHQEFKQTQESLQITVAIIDRYLQETPHIQRNQLQLIGVTAMCIACKYEEVYPPDVSDFVYVTAGTYTKKDLLRCEQEIMVKLGFCFSRPPPLYFLRRYVKAAHGDTRKHNLAKYFVELCLVDYSMVHYKPSELSAAAVCLSLHLLTGQSLSNVWNPTLTYYSGYAVKDLVPIIKQIAKIVAIVEKSKYKSVYNKYLGVSNSKVASLPELKTLNVLQFDLDLDSPLSQHFGRS